MDRRKFIGLGLSLPVVGSLLLNKAVVLPDEVLPAVGEPPKLYVPEKPVLVAATEISRPVMEGGLHITAWNIQVNRNLQRIASWGEPNWSYIEAKPEVEVEIRGYATDMTWMNDTYRQGKKLRMYLVAEPDDRVKGGSRG